MEVAADVRRRTVTILNSIRVFTPAATGRQFTSVLRNRHMDVTHFLEGNRQGGIWPVAQITWGLLEPGSPHFYVHAINGILGSVRFDYVPLERFVGCPRGARRPLHSSTEGVPTPWVGDGCGWVRKWGVIEDRGNYIGYIVT